MRRFDADPAEFPEIAKAEALAAIAYDLERIADELEDSDR